MKDLDISEISKQMKIPASRLRFYEEKGLIKSIGRRGLKRLYDPITVEHLEFILLCQIAGFSLEEISQMFHDDGQPRFDRKKLLQKADELDAAIQMLIWKRDGLRHTAACPHENQFDCPNCQKYLRAAGNGTLRMNQKQTG